MTQLFQYPFVTNILESGVTRVNQFVFSGVKRGAILKGGIRVVPMEDASETMSKVSKVSKRSKKL